MIRQTFALASAFAVLASAASMSAAEDLPADTPTAYPNKSRASDAAFNPAISLILNGRYRNLQRDPANWRLGGFVPSGPEVGPGERGFGIDESELSISGNIDPYFSGNFNAAITNNGSTEVEEAFIQNTGTVPGLTIKFGRYLAALGYQNETHAHLWDFADLPLVHQAFLGGQYRDDGVQLRYLLPTPTYVEIGAEFGKGSAFPGTDRAKNGGNGVGLFAHLGDDVGISNSYRVGISYRQVSASERAYTDVDSAGTDVTNTFTGTSRIWALDGVWKWAPNGDASSRHLKLQAEFFHRTESGDLTFNAGPTGAYHSRQKGFVAQAAYQFMPRWRAGIRYDFLDSGSTDIDLVKNNTLSSADFPVLTAHDPKRLSVMLDFSPSEFSRLRLQYARDEARFQQTDSQFVVQYIMSIGAHGAHKF